MERLNPEQEQQLQDFTQLLGRVDGPDDMFPPDIGVREPLKPRPPADSAAESVCVRAVYSFMARNKQQFILGRQTLELAYS